MIDKVFNIMMVIVIAIAVLGCAIAILVLSYLAVPIIIASIVVMFAIAIWQTNE